MDSTIFMNFTGFYKSVVFYEFHAVREILKIRLFSKHSKYMRITLKPENFNHQFNFVKKSRRIQNS